jgi:hypothetical protein
VTSHIGRIYVVAGALVVLFLGWAAVAAHPWDPAPVDPRAAALDERRAQVRQEAADARRIVAARWERYEARLAGRRRAIDRAWHRRKRAEAAYQRRLAVARARRPVIVRTVYAGSGSSGPAPAYSGPSGSGGGSPAPAASPSAPAPVAAPPVVSVGGPAPVTSSGSS